MRGNWSLRIDPLRVVAEILGEPAAQMRNPVNAGYQCPFINGLCIKTSQRIDGPFPVCTIRYGGGVVGLTSRSICVCPKRFYSIDLMPEIIKHCWPAGPKPANPRIAYEVKMVGFGNVDMVIADIDPQTGGMLSFVSVELQAVDITGSYEPESSPNFSVNSSVVVFVN